MNTTTQSESARLEQNLRDLETAVGTPIIPGELKRWCEDVSRLLTETQRIHENPVRRNHQVVYETITGEDAEMNHRVQLLKKKDERHAVRLDELASRLDGMRDAAIAAGANEASVMPQIEMLIGRAQMLIVDLRQQETALRTWLQEAVNRDRGDVD